MGLIIELTVEGRDKFGRLEEYKKFEAHSPVMGFIDMLAVQCGQQTLNITDFGGTSRSVAIANTNMDMTAGTGTTTFGVRVGTGSTAVAITNTTLVSPIAHGTGAGQLSHGANSVSAPVTSGSSRQFTVSRTFTNNSGSAITVNEVGLVMRGGASNWSFLVDRTLSTFTIAAGSSKTWTYTVKVTV